jgi:putative RecB family exonuclease
MTTFNWDEVFQTEFDKAVAKDRAKSGFEPDTWFTAGRGKGNGEEWWRENGPGFAQAFGDWYESTPDARTWTAPDGRPAIELELRVMFGGIPVVMYVDWVVQLGTALVVTDFKSSAREPGSLKQQGLYACGIELTYGKQYRPKYGTHFMCRGMGKDGEPKRYFMQPEPLDGYRYSIEYYTRLFQMLDAADRGGIFLPNPGENCQRCGVNYACAAVGGADAHKYLPKGQ